MEWRTYTLTPSMVRKGSALDPFARSGLRVGGPTYKT